MIFLICVLQLTQELPFSHFSAGYLEQFVWKISKKIKYIALF